MISTPLSNIASNLIHQRAKDIQGNDFSKVENDIVHRSGHYDIVIQDSHSNQQKAWHQLEIEEKILLAKAISGQTAFNWLFDSLTAFLHNSDTTLMIIFTPHNDVSTSIMNPLQSWSSKRPRLNLSYHLTSRTVTVETSCEYIRQRTIDLTEGTNKDEVLLLPIVGSYTYKEGEEIPFSEISIACDLVNLGAHDLATLSSSAEDGLLMSRSTLAKFITISIDASKKICDIKATINDRYPEGVTKRLSDFFDSVLRMINGMMDKWDQTAKDDATEDNLKSVIKNYEAIYSQLQETGFSTSDISLIHLYAQQLFDDFSDLEQDNLHTITSQVDAIIQMIRGYSDGGYEAKRSELNGLSLFQPPAGAPIACQDDKKRSCCCLWPFS